MVFGGPDLDAAGKVLETEGITIGLTQKVGEKVTLGLAYGMRTNTAGAGTLATPTKELNTLHLNVTYRPVENISVRLEYITGERREFGGATFSADRVQGSVQFNF